MKENNLRRGEAFTTQDGIKAMNDYVKTALYAYPALKAAAEEVVEHIERKARLSYQNLYGCADLAAYLIGQIDLKERMEYLAHAIGSALGDLSRYERFLLHLRYFGSKKRVISAYSDEEIRRLCGSRRSYYRRQEKLVKKIGERLRQSGITQSVFYRDYGDIELIRRVDRALASGRRGARCAREDTVIAKLL